MVGLGVMKAEVVRAAGVGGNAADPLLSRDQQVWSCRLPCHPSSGPPGPCKTQGAGGFRHSGFGYSLQTTTSSDSFVMKAGNEFEQAPARKAV